MKRTVEIAKIFLPAILIGILIYTLRGGKNILDGIYIIFPLIYVLQGAFCASSLPKAAIGFSLSTAVFLTEINLWYNMGACIDLALIYLALGAVAYATKLLLHNKRLKKVKIQ